jgi:hypothetical protein
MADDKIGDPNEGVGDKTKGPKLRSGTDVKFVIEIDTGDTNGSVYCAITKKLMRGRFEMRRLKNKVPDDRFANCPDIPGMMIAFDGRNLRVEVRDPLAEKTNAQVLKEAQAAVQAMGWGKPEPVPPRTFTNLTENRAKDWVYWARRYIDGGQARQVAGYVPTMAEIEAMPGAVERNAHDTNPNREKYPDTSNVPAYLTPSQALGVNG